MNSWPPIIKGDPTLICNRTSSHLNGLSEVAVNRWIANKALPWVVSGAMAGVIGAKRSLLFVAEGRSLTKQTEIGSRVCQRVQRYVAPPIKLRRC